MTHNADTHKRCKRCESYMELSGKDLTAKDLAKLADASTLMAAAQLALINT